MVKCIKCNKLITKNLPGLQCITCNKWTHGKCANLTNEQLNVLFSTESADWKCRNCSGPKSKPKRLSFIMPDAEEDDISDSEDQIKSGLKKNILNEIKIEIRDIIRTEMQSVMQFYIEKMDEYEHKFKTYENQIRDLTNSNKNTKLKYDALQQKINNMEQKLLCNQVEIHGIQEEENENILEICKNFCNIVKVPHGSVIKAYRKKSRRNRSDKKATSPIVVVLSDEDKRDNWMKASKKISITSKDLGLQGDGKIRNFEALTPTNSFLLWKAKSSLHETGLCKYVWCKKGVIRVKREEGDRTFIVRSEEDIEKIICEYSELNCIEKEDEE
ncbi:unnamed protein product [Leptosia nina]|uniref:PHD-type domain-containing protein n=1 Tax=Leptosia nina TaxID=320188 RepID=A0AAV1JFH5_9NEOP